MGRIQIQRAVETVKAFLLSKRSREALVFIFFVVISAGFWLMQTLNETYDIEVEYPLQLVNVDEGTVITSDLPETVHVTLRDKGTSLLHYYFVRHKPAVTIDFASHDKGVSFGRVGVTHSEVQKQLLQLIEPSSRIVGLRPDTLEYYFSRGGKKRVPIVFRGSVQVDHLYYLADVRCEPDSVTVWGEEHFLDSLTEVATVVTNLSGLKATTMRKVALLPMRGAKFDPPEVTLTAEVDIYTTKTVQVPIVGTNFPGGLSLRTFPATASITFRVGAKDFQKYEAENFVLTTTYEELLALPDSMLHLQLRSVPEGVSQIRIQPENMQFLIEQTEEE